MNILWPAVQLDARRRRQTLLIAESDRERRRSAYDTLAGQGYEVFATSNAADALLVCERFQGRIDLLLAGEELTEAADEMLLDEALRFRPRLQVLTWPASQAADTLPALVRQALPNAGRRASGKLAGSLGDLGATPPVPASN